MTTKNGTAIASVSNDAQVDIEYGVPYTAEFSIQGTSAILFHRWSDDAVAEKAAAAKNSKAKKTDNVESYVYRTHEGEIAIPGEYVRQAVVHAAKFRQDPRSPRKSAMDLFKAGIVTFTEYASLGVTEWDYLDRRRVMIQRNAITRVRPAMLSGWQATFQFGVLVPEYIEPMTLLDVLTNAGRIVGIADFRPTFGRFAVTGYTVLADPS